MRTTKNPTEAILRINLSDGLTEAETDALSQLSDTVGGLDAAILQVVRRGLRTPPSRPKKAIKKGTLK